MREETLSASLRGHGPNAREGGDDDLERIRGAERGDELLAEFRAKQNETGASPGSRRRRGDRSR